MRGLFHSSDQSLPDADLLELADILAEDLTTALARRVFDLSRADIGELIESCIEDLTPSDRALIVWLVWDLFREAELIMLEAS